MNSLLYIANYRFPAERAYGIQISKMCEALADHGVGVTLLVPTRQNPSAIDPFEYYGLKRNFYFKVVSAPDFYWPWPLVKLSFYFKSYLAARTLVNEAIKHENATYYSRDEIVVSMLISRGRLCIYEAHKFYPKRKLFYRRLKNSGAKIIAISQGIKDEFKKKGFSTEKIYVAPDAVDLSEFPEISKIEARQKIKMESDLPVVLYVGSLFDWKGVEVFLKAKEYAPGIYFVIVGGTDSEHKILKHRYNNPEIIFIKRVKHTDVPRYLKSADVLVLPNTGETRLSRLYTSPLKLFEYMASKRPIVSSDLPSIREILNERNALLIRPDNPRLLAEAVNKLLENKTLSDQLSSQAFLDVMSHTWKNRAAQIFNFIS